MQRRKGPYFVDGEGFGWSQEKDPDVIDYNKPPEGQPGLWCQWIATPDGKEIEWDGGEKFYHAAEWMLYLIEHFIGSDPKAKTELSFLQSHICNGEIEAQGEEYDDRWLLKVTDNQVSTH
jgi:hypothetical protein